MKNKIKTKRRSRTVNKRITHTHTQLCWMRDDEIIGRQQTSINKTKLKRYGTCSIIVGYDCEIDIHWKFLDYIFWNAGETFPYLDFSKLFIYFYFYFFQLYSHRSSLSLLARGSHREKGKEFVVSPFVLSHRANNSGGR